MKPNKEYSEQIDNYPEDVIETLKLFCKLWGKTFIPNEKKFKWKYFQWIYEIRKLNSLVSSQEEMNEILPLVFSRYEKLRMGRYLIVMSPLDIMEVILHVIDTSKRKNSNVGYVYLIIAENGLCKIGKTKDMEKRMNIFTVKFPLKWELRHYFQTQDYTFAEKELHKMFSDKRDVGEWFRLDENDVGYISSIKDFSI